MAAAIRGAVGRAGTAKAKSPPRYQHKFDPKNRLDYFENESSPRLQHIDTGEPLTGAPLLPPTPTGSESEERFCVGGPDLGSCGQIRRSNSLNTSVATFAELTARLEAALGQASLLLNDRLRSLQNRMNAGYTLPPAQQAELLEVADGVSTAAYHMQKWAHIFDSGSTQKPTIPGKCEEVDEAIAMVHYGLPKLMVHGSTAQNGLNAAIKKHGTMAEEKVRTQGIDIEDIRALAPHLERLVMRLGRISSSMQRGRSFREFIIEYFEPRLGRKVADHLATFIDAQGCRG